MTSTSSGLTWPSTALSSSATQHQDGNSSVSSIQQSVNVLSMSHIQYPPSCSEQCNVCPCAQPPPPYSSSNKTCPARETVPMATSTESSASNSEPTREENEMSKKNPKISGGYIPAHKRIRPYFPGSLRMCANSEKTRPPLPLSQPSLTPSMKWVRGPGFWRSFTAICIPLLLSALEGSVTNTALPTISDALNLGTMFSWVATAFLLASTIFQPLYGQLADMWGRKYPMMIAVGVFGIGSAICGWANTGAVLILGRIVQGLGTGGIDLFAEMVLCDIVPLRKRGTYTAIKHVVYATGTTVGPLLGGVFAERGWRWCFWINIPVCVIAIFVLWWWLSVGGGVKAKDVKLSEELRKVDCWGTSLLTSSVILLLVALSQGGASYPWSHVAILAPLIIGLGGLMVFPFYEGSKWCSHPIMPPSIFSNATSRVAFALTAIHGFVTYGVQFYLPPFFQAVKGSNPTTSGIEVLPTTLIIVVLAAVGGPLLSCWGKYKPIHQVGFGVMTLGFGLFTMLSKTTPVGAWVVFQLLVAVGSGIVVSTLLPAVQVELPDTTNGASAGSWAFLRGTGSLFGVAVPGAIFNVRFAQLLSSIENETARAKLSNGQAYQRASSAFVRRFGKEVEKQIVRGFSESLRCVWIVFAIFACVGFVLTFLENQVKMRKDLNTKYGLKAPKSGWSTPTGGLSPHNGETSIPSSTTLEHDAEKSETKTLS